MKRPPVEQMNVRNRRPMRPPPDCCCLHSSRRPNRALSGSRIRHTDGGWHSSGSVRTLCVPSMKGRPFIGGGHDELLIDVICLIALDKGDEEQG